MKNFINKKWQYYLLGGMFILLIAGIAMFFSGSGSQNGSGEGELRTIGELSKKATGVNIDRSKFLVAGVDPAYPPLTFISSDGSRVGFDIELVNEVGQILGKNVKYVSIEWSKKDDYLNSGEVDIVTGMTITKERKKKYAVSKPYFQSSNVALVAARSVVFSANDLQGLVVGVQKDSSAASFMSKFNTADGSTVKDVVEFDDVSEGLVAILTGDIDAFVEEDTILRYYNSHSPGKFRVVEGIDVAKAGIALVAKKGNTKLAGEISTAIDKLSANGTLKVIHDKWFGSRN
ncbi:MAG: hypothetical protein CSB24_06620 [Deltaproteobacteria bacterium]|nr:MAG: hypothetical protein CSB24_06620 [Deltaproteobacteria bacterium]